MKLLILLLVMYAVFSPLEIQAQSQIDSLKNIINHTSDDLTKINCYWQLGKQWERKNQDSVLYYYNNALKLAEKNDWQNEKAESMINIGMAYSGDQKKSLEYVQNAQNIYIETGNETGLMESYFGLGTLHWRFANYPKAIELLHYAVEMGEELGAELTLAKSYDNLGLAYKYSGQFDKAAVYQFKAINLFEKLGDKNIRKTHANIAVTYVQQQNYDKSIEHYKIALNLFLEEGEKHYAAFCYKNIGNVFALLEEHDSSFVYYNHAFEIYQELDDKVGIAEYHMGIGVRNKKLGELNKASESYRRALNAFPENGGVSLLFHIYNNLSDLNFELANSNKNNKSGLMGENITYGHKMHEIAETLGALDLIHLSLRVLYKSYRENGYSRTALKYSEKFIEVQDSLYFKQKQETIAELQTKYETKQKENEILKLEAESAQQRLMIFYLVSFALLLVVLLVWFIYKRKLAVEEKKYETLQKEKLAWQLERKNSELVNKAMNIAQLQENTKHLMADINGIINTSEEDKKKELRNLLVKLDTAFENSSIWKEFEIRFQENHGEFYKNIVSDYPQLTATELKVISLIKLNLNTKEIAEITNRSVSTIENTRNSIRKKIGLVPEENLTTKILAF